MDLTDASGLNRVSLQPKGYQFGFVDGDDWDNNWLIIAGAVGMAGEKWSFPADGMSDRLSARLASRGEAGVGPIGDDFQAANSEPVDSEAFNSEAADSEAADSDAATSEDVERVTIDIVMSFGAILGATEQWRKELAQFPAR